MDLSLEEPLAAILSRTCLMRSIEFMRDDDFCLLPVRIMGDYFVTVKPLRLNDDISPRTFLYKCAS